MSYSRLLGPRGKLVAWTSYGVLSPRMDVYRTGRLAGRAYLVHPEFTVRLK